MRLLVLLPALTLGFSAYADAPIELSNEPERGLVLELNSGIDAVSDAVMTCVDSGGDHPACLCANMSEIGVLRETLDRLMVVRPDLSGKAVFVRADTESGGVTVFLDVVAANAAPQDCN